MVLSTILRTAFGRKEPDLPVAIGYESGEFTRRINLNMGKTQPVLNAVCACIFPYIIGYFLHFAQALMPRW